MKFEVMTITPSMARSMLDSNTANRNLSDRAATKYANIMKNGDWSVTHQGIAFYEDGTLADGQHRLSGIVRADVPVKMLVVKGMKREQAIHIDSHRPRSVLDGIKIGQLNDWVQGKHIAMVNLISAPKRLSTEEILSFLDDMEVHVLAATACFGSQRRYLNPSIILAGLMLAHFYGEKLAKLRRFGEVMLNGMAEGPDEKIIILAREAFLRNQRNGESDKIEKLWKLQKAIHAYCTGEKVGRLIVPKEPVYPYEELFNV